ncbi:caspase family protein [Chondrinema litorale]|uniref:caspase family protein n=1 Tax=Chondrinema litorale TaxID=2994555 RepID=UPI002542AF35|nr:caspase family protein [Chondrinema litorale]UZR94797.1 caspase family protein [Chondrinema litorale]
MTRQKQVSGLLLFLIITFCSATGFSQDKPDDYATIYIYKPKSPLTGIMRHTVRINGKEVGWLRNGSRMRYKIYTTGQTKIDLDSYIYLLGTAQRDMGSDIRTLVEIEPGKKYYMHIQYTIDGSNNGYMFLDNSVGNYEYNKNSLYKSSYPEIIAEEDISKFYQQQAEESIIVHREENDYSTGTAQERVKKYVQNKMNKWQERGRYEKSDEYEARVNEVARAVKIQEFTDEAINTIAMDRLVTEGALIDYDPDNEVFRIKMEGFAPFYLSVPRDEAPSFDDNFQQVEFDNEIFTLVGEDEFAFLSVEVENPLINRLYKYNNTETVAFNPEGLNLEFDPVEVSIGEYEKPKVIKGTTSRSIADVDINIPKTKLVNSNAIAVIIGNKDYENKDVPPVDFAINDAQIMKKYLVSSFGFQENNILYIENARQADFYRIFGTNGNHKARLYNLVKPDISDVFVFYSGHGAPDPESKEGFFVPVNCEPSLVAFNGYPVNTFYANLSQIPYKSLTVVMDACFSGSSEAGMLLKDISPIFIEPKMKILNDEKSRIFTSSTGDQVSSWYRDKNHSLFTYYFLKAIQGEADMDKNKEISMKEIRTYIEEHVPYEARRLTNRTQTPEIYGIDDLVMVKY